VIPICSVETSIEGSVRIPGIENPWREADALIYGWFAQRTFDARRYIYLEWDCLATLALADHFGAFWDESAAGNVLIPENNPDWYWWCEVERLPSDLRHSAAGIAPLNCLLLSHEALSAVCNRAIPKEVYCELRAGTLLRACGVTIKPSYGADNSWHPSHISVDSFRPSIYHPVKS
jgi:hypothetical protein